MSALRDKYAIVGTGKSRLGQVGANSLALLEEAIKNALVEAGLTNKDIDGVVVRGADDIYSHHQMIAQRLGVDASFSTSLDNGGASQILSIILAVMAIEAGLANVVVCGYGRAPTPAAAPASRPTISFRRRSGRKSMVPSSAISARCRSTPSARVVTCS